MTVIELIEYLQTLPREANDWKVTIQACYVYQDRIAYTYPVELKRTNLAKLGESVVISPDFNKKV